jgi:PAS domain S-box-containing protein
VDFRIGPEESPRWVRGTAIVFRSGGDWILLVGHQYLSEEKQRETLSARALLSLPEHVYVFVKDPQKRFCYMNASFLTALGLKLREVINKTDTDLRFPPEQVEVFSKGDDTILQGKEKGPIISLNEKVTSRHGKILSLMTIKMPLESKIFDPGWANSGAGPDAGGGHHILGMAWDMEQYGPQDKEALLREQTAHPAWNGLLNQSTDAIYLKTAEGVYVAANAPFASLVGKSREEILGHTAAELFVDRPALLGEILAEDAALRGGGDPVKKTLRSRILADGSKGYESSVKVAIGDRDGAVQYILGISRNITDELSPTEEKR